MLSEAGGQPRALGAGLKLASLPQGLTARTLIWGNLNLQVGGHVCLWSLPSKARLFQQRDQTCCPSQPQGRQAGRGVPAGSWGRSLTPPPPPTAGLWVVSRPAGTVMPGARSATAAFWVLHAPFQTECDKNLLYKEWFVQITQESRAHMWVRVQLQVWAHTCWLTMSWFRTPQASQDLR